MNEADSTQSTKVRERPSRVLVIGGGSRSLVNFRRTFLRELASRGHEVVACAPDDAYASEVRSALSKDEVRFEPLPLERRGLNPIRDLRAIHNLTTIMRDVRPNRVFAYMTKPVIYGGMAARWAGNIPFFAMITGLGYPFAEGGDARQRALNRVVTTLYRQGLKAAHCVIFQNLDDQALFHALGLIPEGADVRRVFGSGVDLTRYAPQPLPRKPIFLMLSRLLSAKGVREYAEAADEVKRTCPSARFRLAGSPVPGSSGIGRAEVAEWEAKGVIEYLGRVDDVRPALAECRFVVLPSYYREGIPRSLLEGMATGRPLLTTDCVGCRETVEHGRNGLLVPPRNARALAAAMLTLVQASEARISAMAEASLELARERFDARAVDADLVDALHL